MNILIIADSHDNTTNIRKALEKAKAYNFEAIIHAGDLVDPSMLTLLAEANVPIYYAIGNEEEAMEDDISKMCTHLGIKASMTVLEFKIDGKNIAVTHYPKIAEKLWSGGKYDVVIYGHTHFSKNAYKGSSLLLNPGNLAGFREEAKFAIYNTQTHSATIIPLIQKSFTFE